MRIPTLRRLGLAAFTAWCAYAGFKANAQILVGPAGSGTNTFDAQPTVAQGWSTVSVGASAGSFTTAGNLDNHVITNTLSSAISSALGASSTYTPTANSIARWNNNTTAGQGFYIQTRATGNDYLLLQATLQNNTGSNITHVKIDFDWDQRNPPPPVEEIPGHRAFYSLTGERNSWILIPQFSTFTVGSTLQHLSATLPLGSWTNGSRLYIIWADDNGSAGTEQQASREGAYIIDNFAVAAIPATNVVITQHPIAQSVAPGGSVSMSVIANGAFPLTYQWLRNSNIIAGATNPIYSLNAATVADQGFYSVIVSNGFGKVTSTNAFLLVDCSTPVSITSQPADQVLNTGSALSMTVASLGTSPITYQWYRNGTPVANATNATFTKVNAQPQDSGLYQALVINCLGSLLSSNAVASVANSPVTIMGMTNQIWRYEQSGADLGTSWRATNFNDSAWPQGRGILAREDNTAITPFTNTVLSLTNGAVRTTTFYFRTHFAFTNDKALVSLISTNYIDDGAVYYLNGVEVFRVNMNAGNVEFDTFATTDGPQPEGTYYVTNIPLNNVILGDNVLAVEIHQNSSTSTDVDFGMAMAVVFKNPSPLIITNQPQSLVVEETKPAILTLGLQGDPAYYQWYRNGVAVSNGTANPFVIPITATNNSGSYYAVATNIINSVTSSVVTLLVYDDTNAPVLVEADGTLRSTNVVVSFDERVLALTATNIGNYRITNTITGAQLTILSATVQPDGTNVILHTSDRTAGQNYILIVNNVRDISLRNNLIVANSSIPVRSLVSLIRLNEGGWRFYNPNNFLPHDLGTAWKEFTYSGDTSVGWGSTGIGIFWNGLEDAVPGPVGTVLAQTTTLTSYFRKLIQNVQFSPGGLQFYLSHVVDDGAIFYLNGTEFFRFNMPTGAVTYQTPAIGEIANVSRIGPIVFQLGSLQQGSNVFAAELHTATAASVDKYFGIQLDASVQSFSAGPVIITSGPGDVTVVEGGTATFKIVQAGGSRFQWQQNSNVIAGATNDSYSIPNVPLSLNGAYFRVAVSNSTGGLISTNGRIRVITDTNGPMLFSAYASPNSIVVTFSEPVTSATANNVANYMVTNSAGTPFAISSAVSSSGTNVTLSFASLPPGTYFVVVNNVRDTSVAGNLIAANSTVRAGFAAQIVPITGTWRYDQSGIDRGPSSVWAARTYNDSSWTGNGPGLFAGERNVAPNGAGGNYPALPEPVSTALSLSNNGVQLSTYYFRTHFNAYASGAGVLTFRTILDDGAVIYLNGVEVYRLGIANNVAPGYGTLASRSVGDAAYEGPFSVPVNNVLAGDNVIAVQVHQVNLTSSDIEWAGDFSLSIPSVIQVGPTNSGPVCTNISWNIPALKYLLSGTNVILSWSNPATNNCGSNAVFTLQQSLELSNPPGTTPWANVSPTSPYVTPTTNAMRYFRLRL